MLVLVAVFSGPNMVPFEYLTSEMQLTDQVFVTMQTEAQCLIETFAYPNGQIVVVYL